MQIDIQARQVPMSPSFRRMVKQRVQLSLSKFDESIVKVSLWLTDLNGPKGGVDKKCQMQIVMPGKPDVIVDVTRDNLYLATNLAISRAAQAVIRSIDRQRTRLKRGGPALPMLAETA